MDQRARDVLNEVGTLKYKYSSTIFSLIGVFLERENQIIFKGRTTVEVLRNIYEDTSIRLWGKIKNHEVTALNCFIHDSECWTDKSDNFGEVSITLCPSEIIIGRCFENEIHVKEISMEIPSLNYMFPNNNLLDHLPTKDNPSILGFSFPAALVAEDKYGKLSVHRHLSMSSSIGERKHTIIPRVEYNFDNQMPMREAISRVAAARNFFSFFANHFIPLGFIEFSDSYKECGLIINHDEMIDAPYEPFLISYTAIEKDFSRIWNNWLLFYEEAPHVSALFYEIICNRSTHTNRFLNLAQAIEIYSCQYREDYAKTIMKRNNSKRMTLAFRLEDILQYVSDCLTVETNELPCLAKAISEMRNFYTHYSKNRTEPAYTELVSGSQFLELILLILVCKKMGIENDCISDCSKRAYFSTITQDCEVLSSYYERSNPPK